MPSIGKRLEYTDETVTVFGRNIGRHDEVFPAQLYSYQSLLIETHSVTVTVVAEVVITTLVFHFCGNCLREE